MLADTLEPVTVGNHMETNVHGIHVRTPDADTEKNVQGNDVPLQDQEKATQAEAARVEALRRDAAKVEAEAEEARKKEQGPGLIEEEQFGLFNDIFAGAGKLSIGAAMRGLKQGVEDAVSFVRPAAVALTPEMEAVRRQQMVDETDFWSPRKPEPMAVEAMPEKEVVKAVAKKPKPSTVIVLPSEMVKLVRQMKENPDLTFAYQAADRGQVLGTGAEHGIANRVDRVQQVAVG